MRNLLLTLAVWSQRWLGLTCVYLALLLWHRMSAGELPLPVAAWLFSILLSCLLSGDVFIKYALRDGDKFNNQPLRLLTGVLFVSVFLFVARVSLPFGLAVEGMVLLTVLLILWLRARRVRIAGTLRFGDSTLSAAVGDLFRCNSSELIFFATVPLAVTAWCRELLCLIKSDGEQTVFRAWQDIFYHICQISAFAAPSGGVSDVSMSGTPVHPYHMASYMLPALLVDAAGSSAMVAYTSLLVPIGILATALAAYSLCNVVFGRWPALSASLGLLLLPDAFQQGFGNPFFSYHCMQQINPAGGYGVACAALAFMLLFEACRTNDCRMVFLGFFFVVVTLLFKAQIFVAISFLAMVFPTIFMGGRVVGFRIPLFLISTIVYFGVVALSQSFPSVPSMRLDGSGLTEYPLIILRGLPGNYIQVLNTFFGCVENQWLLRAGAFALLITFYTFGFFSVAYVVLFGHLRRSLKPAVWLFPLLVVSVYLTMACGLAMDDRHVGADEELLHRPFVWAYFVIVVWCVGAAYHRMFGDAAPAQTQMRLMLVILFFAAAFVPICFGKNVQTIETWRCGHQVLPTSIVNVALFIWEKSNVDDIVQDSMNDRGFILSALTERKSYAVDVNHRKPAGLQARLDSLLQLKETNDGEAVKRFMEEHAIKWYVVNPNDHVNWAGSLTSHAAFECGGFTVYRF